MSLVDILTRNVANSGNGDALVLFTGGIDSTVNLYLAKRAGMNVTALMFNHAARPAAERARCIEICKRVGVKLVEMDVPSVNTVVDGEVAGKESLPERYPIYWALATAYAKNNGIRSILCGEIKSDFAPHLAHARASYYNRVNRTLASEYRGEHPPRVVTPLLKLDKTAVVHVGVDLGVPMDLTWSCESNTPAPCTSCGSCRLRITAIDKANARPTRGKGLSRFVAFMPQPSRRT